MKKVHDIHEKLFNFGLEYYKLLGGFEKYETIKRTIMTDSSILNSQLSILNFSTDVRKYDENIGRFTSIDPLWEKYQGWTPYQYSMNNPVNMLDDNGKDGLDIALKWALALSPAAPIALGAAPIALGLVIIMLTPGDTPIDHQMKSEDNNPPPPVPGAKGKDDEGKISEEGVTEAVGVATNTNPYNGPVTSPVTLIDPAGNAIPINVGEHIQGSPNRQFEQVYNGDEPTGLRKEGPHGPTHKPEGKAPHYHLPEEITKKLNLPHWLPIK